MAGTTLVDLEIIRVEQFWMDCMSDFERELLTRLCAGAVNVSNILISKSGYAHTIWRQEYEHKSDSVRRFCERNDLPHQWIGLNIYDDECDVLMPDDTAARW